MGHFGRMCFLKQARNVNPVEVVEVVNSGEDELISINIDNIQIDQVGNHQKEERDWITTITVEDTDVVVKLDTGAQVNILTINDYNKLKHKSPLFKVSDRLIGYNGGVIPNEGRGTFNTYYKGSQYFSDFYVVSGAGVKSILGQVDCVKFGLVARINEISKIVQLGYLKMKLFY